MDESKEAEYFVVCRLVRKSMNEPASGPRPWESVRLPYCWAVSPPINQLPNRHTDFSWQLFQASQGIPFASVPLGMNTIQVLYRV